MFRCRSGLSALLTIFSLLIVVAQPVSAADVSGVIDTDTTWTVSESPYRVLGNIQVSEDATLTIEPGVRVTFQPSVNDGEGFYILVRGTLDAQGAVGNPIFFTAEDRLSPWGGIVFLDQSRDWDADDASGCILEHCVIEFAGNSTPYGTACIFTFSAQPMIRSNTIRYGSGIAIAATDILAAQSLSGRLQILSNRIHGHGLGIRLNLEGATVQNNYLIDNTQALDVRTNSSDLLIRDNTLISDAARLTGAGMNLTLDLDDADNGIAAYRWEQTAGPAVELTNPNSPLASFTAPLVGAVTATLVFDLTVSDDDGLSHTESLEILVIGTNIPPVARCRGRPDRGDRRRGAAQRRGIVRPGQGHRRLRVDPDCRHGRGAE